MLINLKRPSPWLGVFLPVVFSHASPGGVSQGHKIQRRGNDVEGLCKGVIVMVDFGVEAEQAGE